MVSFGDTEDVARATFARMHPDLIIVGIVQDADYPWTWHVEVAPGTLGL